MLMDELDYKILQELQKNSRLSIRELSKLVNLSPPSVSERVRKLEFEGVIEGYTIKINEKKLGLLLDCILEVTIKNCQNEKFSQLITSSPYACFCYRVTGPLCYIVKISVPSLEHLEEFINRIAPVASTVSHIVISTVDVKLDMNEFLTTSRTIARSSSK
ncbi:Lrp/AsnC family transcriptional regulator [Bacillus cereus]|uniref:Lrp/AsnC family transcriptional regulator n=1 Tax=Bacillus cereus TaxID=1396 RepID=UPI000BFE20CD|nr:Lrp/AsnC family transcriptional regulator [Bacillus cereus]PGR70383.1 AsnC family transcriptional regulator [Bacillus cereus]